MTRGRPLRRCSRHPARPCFATTRAYERNKMRMENARRQEQGVTWFVMRSVRGVPHEREVCVCMSEHSALLTVCRIARSLR